MDDNKIYQHFGLEEKDFVDRAGDWLNQVENQQTSVVTYFLNPREAMIMTNLANQRGIQVVFSPEGGEYRKALLFPGFYDFNLEEIGITLLEIFYVSKFGRLSYSQILGAFLGETGLDRREIGDILVDGNRAQVWVKNGLVPLFSETIQKIGKIPVQVKEVASSEAIQPQEDESPALILVSSLRLDKILAATLKIPRNLAVNMIQSNKVKVNYAAISRNDFLLSESDLISVRGFGRIQIGKSRGKTKKEKEKIEVLITNNRKKGGSRWY